MTIALSGRLPPRTCSGATACDFSGWTSATEYAQNGGGIWGRNLGGPVSGISSSAYWLWTANNFSNVACNVEVSTGCTDQNIALRVRIQVPEPSTLLLD